MEFFRKIDDIDKIENFQEIKRYLDEPLENLFTHYNLSHNYLINLHDIAKITTSGELGYLYETDDGTVYELLDADSRDNDEQVKLLEALDFAKKLYKRGVKLNKKEQKQNHKMEKELRNQQYSNHQTNGDSSPKSPISNKELVASTVAAVEESLANLAIPQKNQRSPFLDHHQSHQSQVATALNDETGSNSNQNEPESASNDPHNQQVIDLTEVNDISSSPSVRSVQDNRGAEEAVEVDQTSLPGKGSGSSSTNSKVYEDKILSLQLVISRIELEKVEQQGVYEARIRKLEANVNKQNGLLITERERCTELKAINERVHLQVVQTQQEMRELQRRLQEAEDNNQYIQQLQDRNLWLDTQLEAQERLIANLRQEQQQQQGKSVTNLDDLIASGEELIHKLSTVEECDEWNDRLEKLIKRVDKKREVVKVENEVKKRTEEHILCGICYENRKNIVFLPCGHIFCCKKCSDDIRLCPTCRGNITSKTECFF